MNGVPGELDAWGTNRRSALVPGRFLVHADLHNHTRISDGAGEPELAYASMRRSGLDVAAVTDHLWATDGGSVFTRRSHGLDDEGWQRLNKIVGESDAPGSFVALRGFEWSDSTLGHVNVWFSDSFVAPRRDSRNGMADLWNWMQEHSGSERSLASFNHPGGRGTIRFADFRHQSSLQDRVVGLEMFNKLDDYLLEGIDLGQPSPLVHCLGRGWTPGLIGVSDEHGDDWGVPEGKGRTGLWVKELTAGGVWEALTRRACFATREKGMRLAVVVRCGTRVVEMGGVASDCTGPAEMHVDIELGRRWADKELTLEVLSPGPLVPSVAARGSVVLGSRGELQTTLEPFPLDEWGVLRVSDPAVAGDRRGGGLPLAPGRSIAYSSPIWRELPAG